MLRKSIKIKNNSIDSTDLWKTMVKVMTDRDVPFTMNPGVDFDHLFDGYESAYYGYLWSEVYSADLF